MKERIVDFCPKAETITSRANPLVVALGKLSAAKHRAEQGLFLAEGVKLSEEAAGLFEIRYVLLCSEDGTADVQALAIASRVPETARVLVMPPSVFDKITTEHAPQGIITVLAPLLRLHRTVCSYTDADIAALHGKRLLAVDGVQDPGNLGTMIRTAAAFGYTRILLCGCADLYHPKTVRASMGALFRMEIDVCDTLSEPLAELHNAGHRIVAAALAEQSLTLGRDALCPSDCVVIGNEGHGVSDEVLHISDAVMRIPMSPGAESLNAAGAAAVLMWEYYRTFG